LIKEMKATIATWRAAPVAAMLPLVIVMAS